MERIVVLQSSDALQLIFAAWAVLLVLVEGHDSNWFRQTRRLAIAIV